jgi:hypothetical protein
MTLPEKLPIARMEDYHTHYLGKTIDRRVFWGYETFAYSPRFAEIKDNNPWKYRSDYAILHLFDPEGFYQSSKAFTYGKGILPQGNVLEDKLQEWVSELGDVAYCDIEIRLFSTIIDGITFGLIPNSEFCMIDLDAAYQVEGVDYEIIGLLKKEELTGITALCIQQTLRIRGRSFRCPA